MSTLRDYKNSSKDVRSHYKKMRANQSISYYNRMVEKWSKFDKELSFTEIFDMLDDYVDLSDPDLDIPNRYHAFQTAEAMRKAGEPEWFQLVGILHDVGKIMVKIDPCDQDGQSENEQWGVAGDTWILGHPIPDSIVFPEYNSEYKESFLIPINYGENKEVKEYNSGYPKEIGITNVKWSWGHDEYLYRVLDNHIKKLINSFKEFPQIGLDIIRLHSAYVWHTQNEYKDLMEPEDEERLEWVRKFNKYDLYTKERTYTEVNLDYYQELFEKFFGPTICF